MAARRVFYSWQSDRPNSTNRGFIEDAIERAIKDLKKGGVELDVVIDRDTADKPGSPDIRAAIFDKIDKCSVFIADISLINDQGMGGRLTSNPNVLVETGYAACRLGWELVILVTNEAFGPAESLPFDLRPRRAVRYTLHENGDKTGPRATLVPQIKGHLEQAFAYLDSLPDRPAGPVLSAWVGESLYSGQECYELFLRNIGLTPAVNIRARVVFDRGEGESRWYDLGDLSPTDEHQRKVLRDVRHPLEAAVLELVYSTPAGIGEAALYELKGPAPHNLLIRDRTNLGPKGFGFDPPRYRSLKGSPTE
ncbi:MAG: hypothetical protein IT370_06935 [Deltaproteobacteria bacterium]|nr:hypothetical protein [Deltaproteobacteria bacterium]